MGGDSPDDASTRRRAEVDVSQTALREALRALAGRGLVEARQERGTIVRSRSGWNLLDPDVLRWQVGSNVGPDMFEDLAEVRAIIEPASAPVVRRAPIR